MTGPAVNDRSEGPGVLPPDPELKPAVRGLLETAVVAFARRGYHGVSIRDLTSELGTTVGSVYNHFASKEALLFELIHSGHEFHQAALRDGILGAGPDPVAQLRQGVSANVAFHATYPLLATVANNEMHALGPDNQERIAAIRQDSAALLSAVIERGNDAGVFDCADVWLAVSAIGAMGIRVASWYRPPWLAEIEPANRYPGEVATWLPAANPSIAALATAYAGFALDVVHATP